MGVTAITIGSFDGVHAGHRALVRAARERAGSGGRVVAMAFDPHPMSRLRPEAAPARLTTWARRDELLREAGADDVVRLSPSDELLGLEPEAFLARIAREHAPGAIVEGEDFHFGRGRAGTIATLRELGAGHGMEVVVIPAVEVSLEDQLVARASSTLTRWLIAQGRVADAARVLGRPYELSGDVVVGDRRGRTIGFPTANLRTDLLLPGDGVYAAVAALPDGREVPAAVNVGARPTFAGQERRVEAHLVGVSARAGEPSIPGLREYGWALTLRLAAFVRDQVRFESVGALVGQLARDCARVREVVERRAGARSA